MRIYLAGAGTDRYVITMPGLFNGIHLFTSFFDCKEPEVIAILRRSRPASIVCDSGAFAYFSATAGYESSSPVRANMVLPNVNRYLKEYVEFVLKTAPQIDHFVEIDTVKIHGSAFQQRQRSMLLEALHGNKARLIPVYHAVEPIKNFWKLLDEYPYIALEGIRSRKWQPQNYLYLAKEAYDAGVKTHVFAAVDNDFLRVVPAYSSDSSTWSGFWRFGNTMKFDGTKMICIRRSSLKNKFHKVLGHMPAVAHSSWKRSDFARYIPMVRKILLDYTQYAKYLTALWAKRNIHWNETAPKSL